MTAWSALTRYDSPEIQVAVEANLKTLNEWEPGFGMLIERSLSVCREHAAQMVPVKKERTWKGMEAIEDKVILAYSMAEPVALNDLLQSSRLAIVRDHPEVRKTVLASLTALGKKQTAYDQVWCTFSDYPNLLREFIRVERQSRYSMWSENDLEQIEASL